jgi:hypothetical protein
LRIAVYLRCYDSHAPAWHTMLLPPCCVDSRIGALRLLLLLLRWCVASRCRCQGPRWFKWGRARLLQLHLTAQQLQTLNDLQACTRKA